MSKPALILCVAALAVTPLAHAFAQIGARPQLAAERMDSATKIFVKSARIGSDFEVDSSKLALRRSQNPDIRAFAERMVTDHTKMGEQLDAIARRENVVIPDPTSSDKLIKKHQQFLATLRGADDRQFDRLYVQNQIAALNETAELFAHYARKGDNEALKIFAQETLPVLLEHRKHLDGMRVS
jgi:putative membrane protein